MSFTSYYKYAGRSAGFEDCMRSPADATVWMAHNFVIMPNHHRKVPILLIWAEIPNQHPHRSIGIILLLDRYPSRMQFDEQQVLSCVRIGKLTGVIPDVVERLSGVILCVTGQLGGEDSSYYTGVGGGEASDSVNISEHITWTIFRYTCMSFLKKVNLLFSASRCPSFSSCISAGLLISDLCLGVDSTRIIPPSASTMSLTYPPGQTEVVFCPVLMQPDHFPWYKQLPTNSS